MIHAFLGLEVFASRRDLDRRLCEGALGLRLSHHSVFISMKSIRRRGDKRDVRNEARRREWVAELHTVEGMNCSALQCIAVHCCEEEGDCEERVTGLRLGVFYYGE